VVRSTTVISSFAAPVTGRYKLSRTTDGFVARAGARTVQFRGIVDEFGPEFLGKTVSDTAVLLPPPDVKLFRASVTKTKLLVIIP
jgi:hypothetical protein